MKTEPTNICAWCINTNCIINEAETQSIETKSYPEITACDDYIADQVEEDL